MSTTLARRDREMLDLLYRLGRATVTDVLEALNDGRSYSTVRTQLRCLEEKGHARHEVDGRRFVYLPSVPSDVARRSALRHVVDTFFGGSPAELVATLLGSSPVVNADTLDRIDALVARARKEGRS